MTNSNQNPNTNTHRLSIPEPSIISVFEHQRLTSHDFTQVSDFEWLMAQEFAVFTIKRQRGQWQLKVGHYIGIILLPSGMTLEILPKPVAAQHTSRTQQPRHARQSRRPYGDTLLSSTLQTRQWVRRMLSDLTNSNNSKLPGSKNLGQLSADLLPLPIPAPPLSEWLVTQFLQRLSTYHPTKHYQAQTHNQPSLQGKLLIKEQLRRNSTQPHKFICETSVLSQDMLSNRLIKSALLLVEAMVLSQLTQRHGHYKKYEKHENYGNQATLFSIALTPWRQIAALSHHERRRLESIYGQAKRQLNAQPFTQQQLHSAQQLLDLAYWLLQQSSADTGSSLSSQTLLTQPPAQLRLCLLIDMNQAFEQWASQRITAVFNQVSPNYQPLYQTQRVWLSDSTGQACLSIRPDLLIYQPTSADTMGGARQSRRCSHVIDIKWKPLSHSGAISASDAYQLTSYAQAYQAEQVWLIYPVIDNARQPIALKQHLYGDEANDGDDLTRISDAKLWLMPFNVLTGRLNGWPVQSLCSE